MIDYIQQESDLTREIFDLDLILDTELKNDIQIIRGEDYQYMCFINGKVFATGLTPTFALMHGVKVFNDELKK